MRVRAPGLLLCISSPPGFAPASFCKSAACMLAGAPPASPMKTRTKDAGSGARGAFLQELRDQLRTAFDGALLRPVVDVNDAEAAFITVRPFEVVEQRPDEITAD